MGRCAVLQMMLTLMNTQTVSAYIRKCVDDVFPKVHVWTFSPPKALVCDVQAKLKELISAFSSEDPRGREENGK